MRVSRPGINAEGCSLRLLAGLSEQAGWAEKYPVQGICTGQRECSEVILFLSKFDQISQVSIKNETLFVNRTCLFLLDFYGVVHALERT